MPKLSIVKAGHPALSAEARPLDPARIGEPVIQWLIDEMIRAMRAAPGVGLAAPQLGLPLRIVVLEDTDAFIAMLTPSEREQRDRRKLDLLVVVNPEWVPLSDKKATFHEGCLSIPGYLAEVERHFDIELTGWDREGRRLKHSMSGWPARIVQHEIDHLKGRLYIERMHPRTFVSAEAREAAGLNELIANLDGLGICGGPGT